MTVPEQLILSQAIPTARAREDELELAVREHAKLVFRIAFCVLKNHHDAEDVAQETFLKLLRLGKRWAEIRDPRAWLARVAWRAAVRRAKPRPEIGLEQAAGTVRAMHARGTDVEAIASTGEMHTLLERLITALPRDLRDAVKLSTVDELNSAEIAAVLGIPEGSVRTRQMRAREILREKFKAVLEPKNG